VWWCHTPSWREEPGSRRRRRRRRRREWNTEL